MSLVQRHHLILAGATVLAVAVPIWALQPQSIAMDGAPPLVVTALHIGPVGGLDLASASPLFSSDRMPFVPIDPAQAAIDAAAPATAPPAPLPLLVGIVARVRGNAVALVRGADGQTVTIGTGESVDGWELARIGSDQVEFVLGGERQTARLDFGNKAGGAPPPATPPPTQMSDAQIGNMP